MSPLLTRQYRSNGHIGDIVVPGQPAYRDAHAWPFAADYIFNLGIGSNAVFEGLTGRTANLVNSGYSPNINANNSGGIWAVQYGIATASDPLVSLTVTQRTASGSVDNGNGTYTYNNLFRVPASFSPTGAGDGWCTVLQADGTLYDAYKLTRNGANTMSALYFYTSDVKGTPYQGGTRASNIPLLAGTITTYDWARWLAGGHIGHALGFATHQDIMRKNPVDLASTYSTNGITIPSDPVNGDGKLMAAADYSKNRWGYVWPAHGADSSTVYGDPTVGGVNVGIAMGSWWGIPPSVDIGSLGLTPAGLELAYTLQNYGMFVSAVGSGAILYATPEVEILYGAGLAAMRGDWANLFPRVRRLLRTNNPPSVTWNAPVPSGSEGAYILGGGTRSVSTPPFTSGI